MEAMAQWPWRAMTESSTPASSKKRGSSTTHGVGDVGDDDTHPSAVLLDGIIHLLVGDIFGCLQAGRQVQEVG